LIDISQGFDIEGMACNGILGPCGVKAYVTIMEGCNNSCSYCVVPYVRGRERSRSYSSISKEVENLIRKGVKEITLLGQNVNSYRSGNSEGFGFPELLRGLSRMEGLQRMRFMTSNPKDFSQALIECFVELAPVCEHIHLPMQSGSDRILTMMNRGYTIGEYTKKVEWLRARIPEISITSDIIVGFPGETEKDFGETLEALEEIRFDAVFSFRYSSRPGTQASMRHETLSEEDKARRLKELQALQRTITLSRNQTMVGRQVEVLVEGSSKDGVQLMGRTRTNKIVNFAGPGHLLGQFCEVTIVKGCKNSLTGLYGNKESSGVTFSKDLQ
jgi:tRNA-2-methylthio-N6-dimethylallyladenosine synthase